MAEQLDQVAELFAKARAVIPPGLGAYIATALIPQVDGKRVIGRLPAFVIGGSFGYYGALAATEYWKIKGVYIPLLAGLLIAVFSVVVLLEVMNVVPTITRTIIAKIQSKFGGAK